MEVKALACQLPKDLGLPLSHLTYEEIAGVAVQRGITARISGTRAHVARQGANEARKFLHHRY